MHGGDRKLGYATMGSWIVDRASRARDGESYAGAFRRSELVALHLADLAFEPDGMRVQIRHSKTDQEGQGQEIAIPRGTKLRPVKAVQT